MQYRNYNFEIYYTENYVDKNIDYGPKYVAKYSSNDRTILSPGVTEEKAIKGFEHIVDFCEEVEKFIE